MTWGSPTEDITISRAHLDALDPWAGVSKDEGASKAELSYNAHHLKETVMWLRKGPISDSAAKRIDGMWEGVKHNFRRLCGITPMTLFRRTVHKRSDMTAELTCQGT